MVERSEELLVSARKRKSRAIRQRNRGKLGEADALLKNVAEELRAHLASPEVTDSQTISDLKLELSDVLGTRGGVQGRMGDDHKAWDLYEEGVALEKEHGRDTYNHGNSIRYAITVGRRDPSDPELRKRIDKVAGKLAPQVEGESAKRADEWWAWADLAQLRLLQGKETEARRCYDRGRGTGPSPKDYRRSVEVLREICEGLPASAEAIRVRIQSELAHLDANSL